MSTSESQSPLALIEDLQAELERAKAEIADIKARFRDLPRAFAAAFPHPNQRLVLARSLYWSVQEVPVAEIGKHLLGCSVKMVPRRIGAQTAGPPCHKCGAPRVVTSRMQLGFAEADANEKSEARSSLCDGCKAAQHREVAAAWTAARRLREARLHELRTMPYVEYLRTPEWQGRRRQQLRSVGYKCQLCNRANELQVHHRTYERRGCEWFKDLLVLCNECHHNFHQVSSVAGSPASRVNSAPLTIQEAESRGTTPNAPR